LRAPSPTLALLALVATLGAVAIACGGGGSNGLAPSSARGDAGASNASDGGAGEGSTAAPTTPEGMFRALEADLVKTCGGNGGACHVNGTLKDAPRWLAPPDAYVSAKGYPGVIPADNDLEHSILLTQIEHTGPALVNSPALYARVRNWIAAELDNAKVPETPPFAVTDGFNSVDLSPALQGLDGARLVFTATAGSAGMTLSAMRIVGATVHTMVITDPFFVVVPQHGPVIVNPTTNGFVGDLTVPAGQTVDFYDGILLLPTWAPTNQLALALNKIHLENPPPDAGTVAGGCTSVASFTANAVPAFKIDLGSGATCLGCHGGGDDVAVNAMDLTAVGTDDARACTQARFYVNLKDKPNSQLILTPMGQANPVHPIINAPQTFAQGILSWLANETP
jgi:hypothetical protein